MSLGRDIRSALLSPYRFAFQRSGAVVMSPQVAFVGAFVVVYLAALTTYGGRLGHDAPIVLAAIALAFGSIVVGITTGWRRWGETAIPADPTPGMPGRYLAIVALAITAVGFAALAVYFVRIGAIPLFMASAEQGRVDAAERGGAPLRVLALLTLPGAWLAVGVAVRSRRVPAMLAAVALLAAVAVGWILTANRAPSFVAVEVAVVVALLTAGRLRLPWSWTAALAAFALGAVLVAGAIGAVRLASAPMQGPPAPGQTSIPRPPQNYPKLLVVAITGYAKVPVENLRYTMAAVPERIGWRLGLTYLQPLLTVMPGKQTTFDADLKSALEQRYLGGGTVPGLLGESYANFGPLGWAVLPGLIAYGLVWLFSVARRLGTVSAWALYAFVIVQAANGTISGLIVASPFPYVAIAVLGATTLLEWYWGRRVATPATTLAPERGGG